MLRDFVRPPDTDAASTPSLSVDDLERSDLAAINHWLSVTRLRTVVIVVLGVPAVGLLGGLPMPLLPVTLVCLATACLSPLYELWMRRGGDLRALVYVQLILDTTAITAGLAVLGPEGQLFRYFYLMTIVPATMVSGTCAAVLTLFSGACYGVLLYATPLDAVHASTEVGLLVIALFIFGAVANQCFFYKGHIRDKNRHLVTTGARLAEANAELRTAVETATGLLEVSRAVVTSLDLRVVMERLHAVAVERLKTDWCATLLVDPASAAGYRILASRGLGAATHAALDPAFWGFGAQLTADDLVELAEIRPGSPEARALRGWPVASGVFAAMRHGNRAVGVFATGYRLRTGAFPSFQRELAVGIATQAAVAIENATLHARQRKEAEISGSLLKVAEVMHGSFDAGRPLERLTELATAIMGCERVSVLLFEGADKRSFRWVAGTDRNPGADAEVMSEMSFDTADFPLVQQALRDGFASTHQGDAAGLIASPWYRRLGFRSLMMVPLVIRGEAAGILAAASRTHATPVDQDARRLFTGIAHQTATALENGRLLSNLRTANNLKSEFISTMSHELRTPLNAIIGYNELLSEAEFGPVTPEQREICHKVLASSRQLLELIQATLDVSRLESGSLPVTLGPVDVRSLLEEVGAQVPTSLVKPEVALSFRTDPGVPLLVSDHPKLKMVVRNLVHNALKFTDRGCVEVQASIDADGRELLVRVRDTGIGIAAEGQAIIFEMFRQVDGSDRRRHDGVGLGLYIVRRLTALLGGTIAVESAEGRGSCFEVRLPVVRAEALRTSAPDPTPELAV